VRVDSADVEAVFDGGALDGHPAVTRHARGSGQAWYVATRLDAEPLGLLLESILTDAAVERLPRIQGVEFVRRGAFLAAINHGREAVTLDLSGTDILTGGPAAGLRLEPEGVALVREE
jgi:beta-galactosidase